MKLNIIIDMGMPPPEKRPSKAAASDSKPTIEEEVRELIECIESGHDSLVEWKTLNGLYKELRKRKGPRAENLIGMIEPVMSKYGMHGVAEKSESVPTNKGKK